MNNLDNLKTGCSYPTSFSLIFLCLGLILLLIACTGKPEPFSILEFPDQKSIYNYSKSGILIFSEPDSLKPAAVIGNIGDMFLNETDGIFIYNDTSSQNRFLFDYHDGLLYVNNKIGNISIPENDDLIPWFENVKGKDLSSLQFIDCSSGIPETYIPYLAKLAEIKPDAGLSNIKNSEDLERLAKIFSPRYIVALSVSRSDYDILSRLTNLEMLTASLEDSVINDPLPSMPELKQLLLTGIDENSVITNSFLVNNRQIERVFIEKNGNLDLSILKPLINLNELVITEVDSVINFDVINDLKKIEVLSLTGDELDYDPVLIRLPDLRWMTFNSDVTQGEFDSFIDAHPDLEIVQMIGNATISTLQHLVKLNKLYGLIITDTVTDIATLKTITNLKYLSLPVSFLDDSLNKVEIQMHLPDTRIAANDGLCLGSGWLLILMPLVLLIEFFGGMQKKRSGKVQNIKGL